VIVGDDDQSLYSGRGGSPDGIRDLYNNPSNDQVSLVNCNRCREAILDSANTFQQAMHNTPRLLNPTKDNGQVVAYRFKSSKAEISYLVSFLQRCITNLPANPSPKDGTVCLFPSWKVLDSYFQSLSTLVPCIKRQSSVDPRRLWLERILQLTCAPNQRFVERLLLNEFGDIKPRHKCLLVQRIIERDISVFVALQSLITNRKLTGAAQAAASRFCQIIEDIHSQNASRIASHVATRLTLEHATVEAELNYILSHCNAPEKEDMIVQSCNHLLPDTAPPAEDPHSILFLTMHGSKGLTKKNVVIPGLEAAWLPGISQGAELDERKRLFYVAITRATDSVLITVPHNRGRNDSLNFNAPGRGQPSAFIAEAGLQCTYHT
jgi:superfamily I DNA/RNA helicase